jgi:hypothetical protein
VTLVTSNNGQLLRLQVRLLHGVEEEERTQSTKMAPVMWHRENESIVEGDKVRQVFAVHFP